MGLISGAREYSDIKVVNEGEEVSGAFSNTLIQWFQTTLETYQKIIINVTRLPWDRLMIQLYQLASIPTK